MSVSTPIEFALDDDAFKLAMDAFETTVHAAYVGEKSAEEIEREFVERSVRNAIVTYLIGTNAAPEPEAGLLTNEALDILRSGMTVGELLEALAAEREAKLKAEQERDTLEMLRPVWAQGWTTDSIAAQCSSAALTQLWGLLGVVNQTEAATKLRGLVLAREPLPWNSHSPHPSTWRYDPRGQIVWGASAKGGEARVLDIRGWGYLTGKGHGALGLDPKTACDDQDALGQFVVDACKAALKGGLAP
jgi:hypothetical protein